MSDQGYNISVEQAKLLGSALRIKIIGLLQEPKTSKQVADLLGESGGNIHYHIKKLYDGGLIQLVEERQVGGVTEKYYKAKGRWFNTTGGKASDPVLSDQFSSIDSTTIGIRLSLTEEQQQELKDEFRQFLESWVRKTVRNDVKSTEEYSIGVKIVSTKQKDDKDDGE